MIPAEASEIESFTPPTLANLAVPPAFKLRPATGREMRKYRRIMQEEGLEYHPKEALRAETLRALQSLYSPEQYEASAARLRSLWALIDQKGQPDDAETEQVDELVRRLVKEWRPLARMGAENSEFVGESLRIAVSMFVVGWTGLDVPFRKEDGRCPLDLVDEVERALIRVEQQGLADKVEGVVGEGIAFLQLCTAAQARMNLSQDEEKKLSSPPSSPPVRSGSTTRRSRKTRAASSKASASSGQARKG